MIASLFAAVVAVVHVYTFYLESLSWGSVNTNRLFKVNPADAETNRIFAFNQGFYNLFIALAIVVGLALKVFDQGAVGTALMGYGCFSALGAGLVLFFSAKGMVRGALIQALPALGGLGFLFLGY